MGRADPLRRIVGAVRRVPGFLPERVHPSWIGWWSPVANVYEVLECGHLGRRMRDPYAPPAFHTPTMREWRWDANLDTTEKRARWWTTTDIFDDGPARRRCVECGVVGEPDVPLEEQLAASLEVARSRRRGHLRVIDGGAA